MTNLTQKQTEALSIMLTAEKAVTGTVGEHMPLSTAVARADGRSVAGLVKRGIIELIPAPFVGYYGCPDDYEYRLTEEGRGILKQVLSGQG